MNHVPKTAGNTFQRPKKLNNVHNFKVQTSSNHLIYFVQHKSVEVGRNGRKKGDELSVCHLLFGTVSIAFIIYVISSYLHNCCYNQSNVSQLSSSLVLCLKAGVVRELFCVKTNLSPHLQFDIISNIFQAT